MKSTFALLAGATSALVLTFNPSAAVASDGHGYDLIRSDLTPSLPTNDPINGVKPGGLPWQIDEGRVRVRADGRMDVRIEGLEIPRNGTVDNPVAKIHAVLYCDGTFAAESGPQTMTTGVGPGFGDARFRVMVAVPETCDHASVLIQPDNPTAPGTPAPAYIASAFASGDDD
jgi:hypothetical protein